MLKLYGIIIIVGILGGVGYGAMWYYNDTQQRIATLRENNAKLEVAIETAEASMNLMKDEMAKNQELMNELSSKLQKAEAYGDELRAKFSRYNLVQEALKNPEDLEGKMNGATAKLWREIVADTGGTPNGDTPTWLQSNAETGKGSTGGDKVGEGTDSNSVETETSTTE